jgi:cell cycle checkpoint protein
MSKSRAQKRRKLETVFDDIEDPIECISTKDSQQLIEKYAPLTSLELAVHKKKLDQVRDWFSSIQNRPRLLILSGPAGSGKTATVQTLARELRFEIHEFETGMNVNAFNSTYQDTMSMDYRSGIQKFRDFVSSCIRSTGLTLQVGFKIFSNHRKIAVIEDFPTLTDSMKSVIHGSLREYVQASSATCPIVIIISTIQTNSESFSGERVLSVRELIPADLLQHPAVCQIQFNPIAKTILMKALNRICELEFRSCPRKKPSKQWIEDTCIVSEGDIRSAIYALQLSGGNYQSLGFRDHQLSLFSGLGKILYNKRTEEYGVEEDLLDTTLLSKRRKTLKCNPEVVFDSLAISESLFLNYLQENYLTNCFQVDELVSCSEYLSIAELIGSKWDPYHQLAVYSTSVASRGLLFSWQPDHPKKHSFQTLSKSRIWTNIHKKTENRNCWGERIWGAAIQEYTLYRKTGTIGNKLAISRNMD